MHVLVELAFIIELLYFDIEKLSMITKLGQGKLILLHLSTCTGGRGIGIANKKTQTTNAKIKDQNLQFSYIRVRSNGKCPRMIHFSWIVRNDAPN